MGMRLVLDDGTTPYVIDGDKTGSASTTTGVRLCGPKEGPFEWVVNEGREAELQCRIRVTAATTAALVTAVDALLAVLNTVRGRSVEIRYDDTNVMFQLPLASWSTFAATTGVRYLVDPRGGGGAEIDVLFTSEKRTTNEEREGRWEYVRKATGSAVATAERTFGTLAAAIAWVNTLRSGAGFPSEISSAFEVIEENFGYPSFGTSPIGDYNVACKVLLMQKAAWIAADNRFSAFRAVECQCSARDVQKQQADAPGEMVDKVMGISGSMILKTEASTDFDAADTSSTAPAAIAGLVSDAIDAVIEGLETRTGEGMEEMVRSVSYSETGEITFNVELALDGANIITWEEDVELVLDARTDIIRDYKGVGRRYPRPGGPSATITHTLKAEAFSRLVYRAPKLDGDKWEFTGARLPRSKRIYGPNGTAVWFLQGNTSWEWVPDGDVVFQTPEVSQDYESQTVQEAI